MFPRINKFVKFSVIFLVFVYLVSIHDKPCIILSDNPLIVVIYLSKTYEEHIVFIFGTIKHYINK